MIEGNLLIGFTNEPGEGAVFSARNPADNNKLESEFKSASSAQVEKAINLAKSAFSQYRNISGVKRADFLDTIADEIVNLGDELVNRAVAETALPEGRIIGERGRTVGQLRLFANLIREGSWVEASIDTAIPDRTPLPKPDVRKMLVPIGPVVVFGASNFPLAFSTAGGDTASALAAGNPVVVKSHPSHPGTSELVAHAISLAAQKTNMPDGVFSHLHDSGFEVGKQLVQSPEIKAVAFTGSNAGGMALHKLAAERPDPIPVFAEMGSVNPVIFLPDALSKNWQEYASLYAGSITLGVGQFCTNPGLLFAFKSRELDSFEKELDQRTGELSLSPMLNQGIYENFISRRLDQEKQDGVRLFNGESGNENTNTPGAGFAVTSALEFSKNPKLHEEIFGPHSLVVEFEESADLRSTIEALDGQLTATVMATEVDLAEYQSEIDLLKEKVGRLILNAVPTGVEVCHSMVHGGPYPATTDSRFTSVGTSAIKRFARPLCLQGWPDSNLPDELKGNNPLGLWRTINGEFTQSSIS